MTAEVTPAKIREVRERTGVGMGKCKEALQESGGDIEKAIEHLRKTGMASAVKKEGREAKEGMIFFKETSDGIACVEVGAETDFVAKNDRFQEFGKNVAEEVASTKPESMDTFLAQKYSKEPSLTMDEYRATIVQAIGENIQVKRFVLIPKEQNKSLGIYSHMGGKLVTLAVVEGSSTAGDLAKEVAMHIAAAAPDFLSPEDVPADVLAKEKEIAASQLKGKPANILDKILEGKMNAFYDQHCLLRQKFIKDESKTVAQIVQENGKDLQVIRFLRWSVGG